MDTRLLGSSEEIQDFWLKNIAPNYFDFSNTNNYRAGVFGYINEVMSTIASDAFNALNIARREFYPVSAQNPKSLYKMAALQQLSIPLAVPATCNAVLLLNRDEVIANSTYKNGAYTCVIDDTTQIYADGLQFSLLYPIVIISTEAGDTWNHTIHYLRNFTNSLDTEQISSNYIVNKTTFQEGKYYLMLSVRLKQYKKEIIPGIVETDAMIDTTNLQFSFSGNLAGFEVFYIAEPEVSKPVQLKKLMDGQGIVKTPFCYYRLITDSTIEISFPKNPYFTPMIDSEIQLAVYTCEGTKGNFPQFKGDLSCVMTSENYPYNNNMKMLGVISGGSVGGKNIPSMEEYRQEIQAAYSTNNTIITSSDLQRTFDQLSTGKNKVFFRKKRADAFERIYGAYIILKDEHENVIPTNTLNLNLTLADFDSYNDQSQKAVIHPGMIFEYDPLTDTSAIYAGVKSKEIVISDDLTEADNEKFLYANPYLIMVTLNPNSVEFYNNSVDVLSSVEHSFMNDQSPVQFIGKDLYVQRDTMKRENFYKISMKITPSKELNPTTIVQIPDPTSDEYEIRAEQNGYVESVRWDGDAVICTIKYEDGSALSIQVNSYTENENGEYIYQTGYDLKVGVYDSFVEGDVLAVQKVEDLGKIRAALNINNQLLENGLYIPMIIEDFDEESSSYTIAGYISTDDAINSNESILIEHGIFDITGHEDENTSLSYKNTKFEVAVFYQYDDENLVDTYQEFDYFHLHTLTNKYSDNAENGIPMIINMDFIRSTVVFTEPDNVEIPPAAEDEDSEEYEVAEFDESSFIIGIREVPLVRAAWIKNTSNFRYLIQEINIDFNNLKLLYYNLENNFGFDLKFYNTYGKSQFFKVGYKDVFEPLSQVNGALYFGIYMSSTGGKITFLEKFRTYVKKKIESINSATSIGQSIYIMNLITDIKNEFGDIGYIEYYGFNDHNVTIQKIEPIPITSLSDDVIKNYIPEFINIATHLENGENIPNIYVEFLNQEDDTTEQQSYNLRNGGIR